MPETPTSSSAAQGQQAPPLTPEQQFLLQLSSQMQQMHQQLADQQASIVASVKQLAPGQSAPAALGARPKIKEPSLYAGDSQKIDGWLQELEQQFSWYRLTVDTDRLALATAHLRGPALDWWCSLAGRHPPARGRVGRRGRPPG